MYIDATVYYSSGPENKIVLGSAKIPVRLQKDRNGVDWVLVPSEDEQYAIKLLDGEGKEVDSGPIGQGMLRKCLVV